MQKLNMSLVFEGLDHGTVHLHSNLGLCPLSLGARRRLVGELVQVVLGRLRVCESKSQSSQCR